MLSYYRKKELKYSLNNKKIEIFFWGVKKRGGKNPYFLALIHYV
jgi:hypothetical protein